MFELRNSKSSSCTQVSIGARVFGDRDLFRGVHLALITRKAHFAACGLGHSFVNSSHDARHDFGAVIGRAQARNIYAVICSQPAAGVSASALGQISERSVVFGGMGSPGNDEHT
jgi:hypothetical protein